MTENPLLKESSLDFHYPPFDQIKDAHFAPAYEKGMAEQLKEIGPIAANTEAPTDKVGLGSRVTVLDLETNDTDTYVVVLAEMIDIDADHISLASPLGRALGGRKVGEEVTLQLPTARRSLRILDLVTIHKSEAAGEENGETGKAPKEKRKVGKANGKR